MGSMFCNTTSYQRVEIRRFRRRASSLGPPLTASNAEFTDDDTYLNWLGRSLDSVLVWDT